MFTLLAAISGNDLVSFLIWVVVVALVWFITSWVLGQVPLPEPARVVIRVVMALILGIFLINAVLSLNGNGYITWRG